MSVLGPDPDSPIHVSVVPSQASYFAGESFSVTITFTNTRSPSQPVAVRSASHGAHATHKRAAHSISSVPIARPPTSPATPKTVAGPAFPRLGDDRPIRRGLIGHKESDSFCAPVNSLTEARRRTTPKPLSLSLSPQEMEELKDIAEPRQANMPDGVKPSQHDSGGRSTQIASHHPHARKQSVFDGAAQLTNMSATRSSSSSTELSPAGSASSLDIITESATPPGNGHSQSSTRGVPRPTPSRGLLSSGLGHGAPPMTPRPSRGVFSSTFTSPGTELLLYSYVQLIGTVNIADVSSSSPTHPSALYLNSLRARLTKRRIVGGGSMDITSSLRSPPAPPARRPVRSLSISNGIMSLLSPRASPAASAWSSSKPGSPSLPDLGVGQETIHPDVDPETPLPTFEVQPVMLAVDLNLAPGEVRTYRYSVTLPDNLPPTFKGRTLKFSYDLLVGTCRAMPPAVSTPTPTRTNGAGSTSAQSSSRIMRVPIRVYPNVTVDRPPQPYDLVWPMNRRKELGSEGKVMEQHPTHPRLNSLQTLNPTIGETSSLEEVRAYARRLLNITPNVRPVGLRVRMPPDLSGPVSPLDDDDEVPILGCREAVEILTRNPKKVSYDVTKDDTLVAVLTFTKSAYRLGETVLGVLELNERDNRARVLKLSAMLETQESLPGSITPPSLSSRQLRRVHAEHHCSFLASTLRTTFALDIPADGTPAFGVDIGGVDSFDRPGGLEWKVRICLLVGIASDGAKTYAGSSGLKHLVRDGEKGEWGSSWKAASKLSPMQHLPSGLVDGALGKQTSWTSFFASPFIGNGASGYHDGDEELDDDGPPEEPDPGGGEEGWSELRLETVECEVPVRIWPGNTAFKATEIVFDV